MVQAVGQRVMVNLKILGRAVIDAERINAEADCVSGLDQEFRGFQRIAGKMHYALIVGIAIAFLRIPS